MKKKILTILLTGLLALSGIPTAFAASGAAVFSDIEGTPYETAVVKLVSSSVLSGYEDGTFRPNNSITRAEACVMVTKAMQATQTDLDGAAAESFTDVASDYWGAPYIRYAASKGVVNGYEDSSFRPDSQVTYYEMAAMLINAMGIKASELAGQWPDNYYAKASQLGMLEDLVLDGSFDGNASATRGNVAIMTQSVLTEIIQANHTKTEQSDPTAGFQDSDLVSTGELEDLDGRAYGIIIGSETVATKIGTTVQRLTFLYDGKVEYAVTKDANTFDGTYRTDGTLDCLQMYRGEVQSISPASQTTTNFREFNAPGGFTPVLGLVNRMITISCNGAPADFTIADDAAFYVQRGSTYTAGSLSDVTVGAQVRLYTVTGATSASGPVEVVIVKPVA